MAYRGERRTLDPPRERNRETYAESIPFRRPYRGHPNADRFSSSVRGGSSASGRSVLDDKRSFYPRDRGAFSERTSSFKRNRAGPLYERKDDRNEEKRDPVASRKSRGYLRNLNDIKDFGGSGKETIRNNVIIRVENMYSDISKLTDVGPGDVEVSLSNVENSVVEWINKYGNKKTVCFMTAWLSNPKILDSLANARRVLGIVNDEDYSSWPRVLDAYDRLKRFEEPLHSAFFGLHSMIRVYDRKKNGEMLERCSYEPVRCFGNPSLPSSSYGSRRDTKGPIMHHKVIIFFEQVDVGNGRLAERPSSFICGSFNPSKSATNNLENAVWIKSKIGATRFFNEFAVILGQSRKIRRKPGD